MDWLTAVKNKNKKKRKKRKEKLYDVITRSLIRAEHDISINKDKKDSLMNELPLFKKQNQELDELF